MTTMELRAELLNEVNVIMDNEDMMKEAIELLRNMRQSKQKPPCAYTIDEVKNRLRLTEADAIAGRGYTTEEVLNMLDKWI